MAVTFYDSTDSVHIETESNTNSILAMTKEASSQVTEVVDTEVAPISNDMINDDLLIVSPYLALPHQLRLSTLDTVCRLVTLALQHMQPLSDEYATTPYAQAFNWNELFSTHLHSTIRQHHDILHLAWPIGTSKSFYVVEFRSTLKADADRDLLSLLDRTSHEEATASGGLLKYWFGSPNASRQNLATCLWRSEEDAIRGGKGPWHKQARQSAAKLYDRITFTRFWLNLRRTGDGVDWRFDEIEGGGCPRHHSSTQSAAQP